MKTSVVLMFCVLFCADFSPFVMNEFEMFQRLAERRSKSSPKSRKKQKPTDKSPSFKKKFAAGQLQKSREERPADDPDHTHSHWSSTTRAQTAHPAPTPLTRVAVQQQQAAAPVSSLATRLLSSTPLSVRLARTHTDSRSSRPDPLIFLLPSPC